jgi:hypothetical protein
MTLAHFKLITITHESSSYQVFHSFYEEMQNEFPISDKTKNLFLSMADVYRPDTECHFMLCLWRNQHGRPLAIGSKGARPTGAL